MEQYYYCTKKTCILLKDVVQTVYAYFIDNKINKAEFNEIYDFLSNKYGVKSFNRRNLSELLQTSMFVNLETVKHLVIKYCEDLAIEPELQYDVLCNYFVNEKDSIYPIINTLGKDCFTHLITDGCEKFCVALGAILNRDVVCSNVEFRANEIDKQHIIGFLNYVNEDELILSLKDENDIKKLIDVYIIHAKRQREIAKFVHEIQQHYQNIHCDNLNAKVKYLFPASISNILKVNNIDTVIELKNIRCSIAEQLLEYRNSVIDLIKQLAFSLPESFNAKYRQLLQLVSKTNKPNSCWEKYVAILEKRANGATLEAASTDCTRERARQIERKYFTNFVDLYYQLADIRSSRNVIRAFVESELFLSDSDIIKLFPVNPKLFKYFLCNINVDDIEYVEELNILRYKDEYNWYDEVKCIADDMPERFDINEIEHYCDRALVRLSENDIILSKEYCKKLLLFDYKLFGELYSRSKMNLKERFKYLWQEYYPEPIDINNATFLQEFRELYEKVYHESLEQTDHATETILSRIGTLRNKGEYIINNRYFISESLSAKIYDYIVASGRNGFLANNLFSIFATDLLLEGIDNKYFMQGALKQRLNDKLFFRRDYICTTSGEFNVYSDIVNFVKDKKRVVEYEELRSAFPGVTDVVFSLALSQEEILWYRKRFVHVDTLNITNEDKRLFYQLMRDASKDGKILHARELLDFLQLTNPEILNKYHVREHSALFSLLQYLFHDEFEFRRPFFAAKGTVIQNQIDRIKDYVSLYDELLIDDLLEYIYDNKMDINSIVGCIDLLQDYCFKNENTIIAIERTNANRYNIGLAEKIVEKELGQNDFIFAENLKCMDALPKEVIWNPWLLYSLFNKFGTNLKVILSNNQFKIRNRILSKPIIIRRELNLNNINELIEYLKQKLCLSETEFYFYLKRKGLV